MSEFTTPKIAAEAIGVTPMSLCQSDKYKMFYKKADEKKCNARFDLKGFVEYESEKSDLMSKAFLLIEYIIHEIGVTIKELSEISGIREQQISTHAIGWENIKKMLCRIHIRKPEYIRSFDEYYEW